MNAHTIRMMPHVYPVLLGKQCVKYRAKLERLSSSSKILNTIKFHDKALQLAMQGQTGRAVQSFNDKVHYQHSLPQLMINAIIRRTITIIALAKLIQLGLYTAYTLQSGSGIHN